MVVAAIAMVRDEADIIEATVSHMCDHVDVVIVADNMSTDNTRAILDRLSVTVVTDDEPGYYQSQKMTALAHLARGEFGADWVVPFDADEWWHTDGRIADVLGGIDGFPIVEAALYDHVATGDDFTGCPVDRMPWRRRTPAPLPKVAVRTAPDLVIHQGNHGAHYDTAAPTLPGRLNVRHFPYRSPGQFARKAINGAAAYAATDLPEDMGAHWRSYGRLAESEGVESLENVFRRWFWVGDPAADESLIFDPAP